ncbi:MAG: helical backbone metal receptor [Bacteroidia bacterium]|nr:helical backbone metal receptor [Bacteroidia bacterium]
MSSRSEVIFDARGRVFSPLHRPVRIVSLVPSLTELLFDLGLSNDEIVGRTKFCIHPDEAVRAVPIVGGTKTVHVQRVLALRPDLVVANREENERATVEELEAADPSVPVFVTNPGNIEESLDLVHNFGGLFRARTDANAVRLRLDTILAQLYGCSRGRVVYLIWRQPYMTITPVTYIHSVLEHLGYHNVVSNAWLADRYGSGGEIPRYPRITISDIADLSPDKVLFSSEPFPFAEKHVDHFKRELVRKGIRLPDCSIVDGELFSWYGSRLLHLTHFNIG